ncbi:site-specific integrase, partial [Acinetobacter baumannii]
GESRNVPLSKEAKRLLSILPSNTDILLPVKAETFKRTWIKIRDAADLKHSNFPANRHKPTT